MKKSILVCTFLMISVAGYAACPRADANGDCEVNLEDLAIMAFEWMTDGNPAGMVWVYIDDPGVDDDPAGGDGVPDHEGFIGEMSKYETTNAQYCEYLNAALGDGSITVYNNIVYASSDTGYLEPYFETYGASTYSQITYDGNAFSVRSRDDLSMDNHPVVEVSWYGASAFCEYYDYRLPTEWEWEAAADYDGSYTYGCGITIDDTMANYDEYNPLGLTSTPYTNPVNHYASFGYGLNDMSGNVFEWTSTVNGSNRVVRGGNWDFGVVYCEVSYRGTYTPETTFSGVGFRACR